MKNNIDVLNREEFVEKATTIIGSYSSQKQNCTFSIDGKWGCGKSFVLDIIAEKLKDEQSEETADNKYLIIKYNCWKYDYYSEPLIAIVTSILDSIDKSQNNISTDAKNKIKTILSVLSSVALNLANNAIKEKTGINFIKIIKDAWKTRRTTKNDIKSETDYNNYFSFDKELGKLQKVLNGIAERYTIVLLVDEIDRCLPQYAIQVLERLHHLTEKINNMVTIIATDRERLDQSIISIYGNISTNDYLKKIIDFSVHLDVGILNDKYSELFNNYCTNFDKAFSEEDSHIGEYVKAIFYRVNIRTMIKTVEKANLIHNIVCKERCSYPVMIVELLLLIAVYYYKAEISNNGVLRYVENAYNLNQNTVPARFSNFFSDKAKAVKLNVSNVVKNNEPFPISFNFDETIAYYWIYLNYDKYYVPEIGYERALHFEKNKNELEKLKQFYDYLKIID